MVALGGDLISRLQLRMRMRTMENQRESARLRMLKSGKIMLGKASVPCTVRNLSDGGACLQVQSTYGLPSAFEFILDDRPPRPCKVVWLDATTVRVQFQ
jgi:hypothetical protein